MKHSPELEWRCGYLRHALNLWDNVDSIRRIHIYTCLNRDGVSFSVAAAWVRCDTMAVRIVLRDMILLHWAIPSVNNSDQHPRTSATCDSWLRKQECCENFIAITLWFIVHATCLIFHNDNVNKPIPMYCYIYEQNLINSFGLQIYRAYVINIKTIIWCHEKMTNV